MVFAYIWSQLKPRKKNVARLFFFFFFFSRRVTCAISSRELVGEPGRAGENRARASVLLNVNIY